MEDKKGCAVSISAVPGLVNRTKLWSFLDLVRFWKIFLEKKSKKIRFFYFGNFFLESSLSKIPFNTENAEYKNFNISKKFVMSNSMNKINLTIHILFSEIEIS